MCVQMLSGCVRYSHFSSLIAAWKFAYWPLVALLKFMMDWQQYVQLNFVDRLLPNESLEGLMQKVYLNWYVQKKWHWLFLWNKSSITAWMVLSDLTDSLSFFQSAPHSAPQKITKQWWLLWNLLIWLKILFVNRRKPSKSTSSFKMI